MKLLAIISAALLVAACSSAPTPAPSPAPQPPGASSAAPSASQPIDWKTLEAPLLTEHLQLTSRDQFVKAGEAYFDHHSPPRWVIFQAVPVPSASDEPDPFYAMYVARLTWKGERLTGIEKPIKISPDGSANTCGWFDPVTPHRVIFGSTLTRPGSTQRPGFQVGTRRYIWMFPHEMEIVSRTVPEIFYATDRDAPQPRWGADAAAAQTVFARPNYDAECSFSKDGRFILYAHVRDEPTRGKDDADIWVYDTQTGKQHEIVRADGYDGGPFFSHDNKRICYRSDRVGNDLLQLFVADLKFDSQGVPVGIDREHQITNNQHVNWAPYFHPSGKFLIYGTSEEGHTNYEVYAVEVPEAADSAKPADKLRHRRITNASGADVLPVFSDDGKYMMWTGQRGPKAEGEDKPSSQVWVARFHFDSGESHALNKLFLPSFPPPTNEAEAIDIARRVIDQTEDWEASTSYRARRSDNGEWIVEVAGVPKQSSVPLGRIIAIDKNGTVRAIRPTR